MPIITTEQIPKVLWKRRKRPSASHGTHTLHLPRFLVDAYGELIDELGLRTAAEDISPNDEGPQGGMTEEETNLHFARNFSGSCARIELVMLDPREMFKTTRDLFVKLFAGGRLHLLDIPCGAGAAGATLLCLAAELRNEGVLPRNPLRVTVVGGDISAPARQIKRRLYRKLKPRLAEVGISVTTSVHDWNVKNADQTSDLIERWIKGQKKTAKTAIFALNFSGFLSQRVDECKLQLREFMRYGRTMGASVVWVEPCTNAAIQHLFPGLKQHVFGANPRIASTWEDCPRQTECRVAHPIQRRGRFTARAAAMHLEPVKEGA